MTTSLPFDNMATNDLKATMPKYKNNQKNNIDNIKVYTINRIVPPITIPLVTQ